MKKKFILFTFGVLLSNSAVAKESFEGAKLSFTLNSGASEVTVYNNSSVKINANRKLLLKANKVSAQELTMSLHVLPELIDNVDQLFAEYPVEKEVVVSCKPSNALVDFAITDLTLKGAVCQPK